MNTHEGVEEVIWIVKNIGDWVNKQQSQLHFEWELQLTDTKKKTIETKRIEVEILDHFEVY